VKTSERQAEKRCQNQK